LHKTIPELKLLCEKLGLKKTGKKEELIAPLPTRSIVIFAPNLSKKKINSHATNATRSYAHPVN
jgi:hypothetical protein